MLGIGEVSALVNTVISRILPDKAAEAKAILDSYEKEQDRQAEVAKKQLEVNSVEAANPSLFVSGWRPGFAWLCIFVFACQYVIEPWVVWLCQLAGVHVPAFPELSSGDLFNALLGLLGLGGMRTFERIKGVIK